jgi:glycosyltransferase involved in cell wall biosynthesis
LRLASFATIAHAMSSEGDLRVLRVYHAGRDPAMQARERALAAAGVEVSLVVPSTWGDGGEASRPSGESFSMIELPVARPNDINRHRYLDRRRLRSVIAHVAPDVLDIHEEPFSVSARQWLAAAPPALPVVMYTAQNIDKRFPPPFAQYERAAHRRASALYPCSAQAASVARGKGYAGLIDVLPLGYDDAIFLPGAQSCDDAEILLALVGRLVPEKGVTDAVRILARLNETRPARLVVHGDGPEEGAARALAARLGVADRLELTTWLPPPGLAATYRTAHVVLVPSRPTETWVEQFGRVIVEGQASGAVIAAYASGSIPEVAGASAILAAPAAAGELADAIVRVLADAADFARRREEGIAASRARTWARVAERHAALYRRVVAGVNRSELAGSPAKRRAAARLEFGPPASVSAGPRPFALPVLRRGGAVASLLAAPLDAAAEAAARLPRPVQRSGTISR